MSKSEIRVKKSASDFVLKWHNAVYKDYGLDACRSGVELI